MKYLKMFNENINSSDIDVICEKYNIKNYTINEDGTIDVDDDVDLSYNQLKVLPLKFRNVSGHFDCSYNQLKNLIGSPQYVGGDFFCINNKLTSLEGAPQKVGGGFYCGDNQLTNLIGAPQNVDGVFWCDHNELKNLIGSPQIVDEFLCHENQLTSLEGCPKKVYGNFLCDGNKLKNIDYLPKYYKKMSIWNNPINKILDLFINFDEYRNISNTIDKELIMDFIDREIIQQDILLVNRLVEFLDDIDKPKSREELIELLKNDYEIR